MDKDKIIRNIKERMAMSNLEKEYSMKMRSKKRMISVSMVLMLFLVGSFVTVNAATGGQLADNVAGTVKSWIIGPDGTKQELTPENYTASDGKTYDKWTINMTNGENNTAVQFLTDSNATITVTQDGNGNASVLTNDGTNTTTMRGNASVIQNEDGN